MSSTCQLHCGINRASSTRLNTFTDGFSYIERLRAGLVLTPANGEKPLKYAIIVSFKALNNKAKYEAFITEWSVTPNWWSPRSRENIRWREKTWKSIWEDKALISRIVDFKIIGIPREENKEVDTVSKYALWPPPLQEVHYIERGICSIIEEQARPITGVNTWMMPIYVFLENGEVLDSKVKTTKIWCVTINYWIIDEALYKRGCSTSYLRCVAMPNTKHILRKLYEGYTTCHEGAKSTIRKVLRQGYNWPTMNKEAMTMIQSYEACQKYSPRIRRLSVESISIPSVWTFAQWGIDLVCPLPRSTTQRKWIIVDIDNFSKWFEAIHLASITEV